MDTLRYFFTIDKETQITLFPFYCTIRPKPIFLARYGSRSTRETRRRRMSAQINKMDKQINRRVWSTGYTKLIHITVIFRYSFIFFFCTVTMYHQVIEGHLFYFHYLTLFFCLILNIFSFFWGYICKSLGGDKKIWICTYGLCQK